MAVRQEVQLSTSPQTIYTAPTGYTGIILYAHVTNYTGSAAATITMAHVRSSTTTQIINAASVPAKDAYIPLDGKLVLETNDIINKPIKYKLNLFKIYFLKKINKKEVKM